jgi:hypothetical protein
MLPYYLAAIDECKLVVVCGLMTRFVINNTYFFMSRRSTGTKCVIYGT